MYVNNTGLPSVTEVLRPYIDTTFFTEEHKRRGSMVHDAVAAHLQGLYVIPLPEDYQPYFDSARRWIDKMVEKVLLVEKRLICNTYRFCGKPDLVAILRGDPEPALVDWKTSQAYQPWWMLQGSGYRHLVNVDAEIKTNRSLAVRFKADGSGCLIGRGRVHGSYAGGLNIINAAVTLHYFFNRRN